MTRKEQNKILDDKSESNVNQYKVDRLNAEISAFSSGDLNKYEFLTRKDLKYKPNALDKARFEFSPLGKAFSMGLDKTIPNYQEEGIIKLLKDIRDSLAGGIVPRRPEDNDDKNEDDDDNEDDEDDEDDKDNDNDDNDMYDLETEEKAKTSDGDKVFNVLNKFKNNIESEMSNLDKMVIGKKNKWSTKLNKLNNDVKKLDNYIKKNNDKKIKIEKKLDDAKDKYIKLFVEYNISELKIIKNELNSTKDKLDKAGNDINGKAKHIDELKKNQKKFDYQYAKVVKLESELNEKNKNIKHLENKNLEIINEIKKF